MTGSHIRYPAFAGACALALILTVPAYAQTNQQGQLLISMDPVVDITTTRTELEDWRAAEQAKLRQQGKATAENFRKIDQQVIERARAAEVRRTEALKILSEKAGGANLGQGSGGTQPNQGRGVLGDIDTSSLSPRDYDRVLKTAKQAGYKPVPHGDGFTIPELDVTVHRAPVGESASPVGSSGRAAEIARGNNPETAYGLGRNDPAIAVSDNLKKAAHTVNAPVDKLTGNDLQKLGKMTGRNLDAIEAVHGTTATPAEPTLRQKADMLKQGYSPEAAGIVRDNATAAERAQDLADFQSKCKQTTVEAVKAADTHAGRTMDKLAGEARQAGDALEAAKSSGDGARIAEAQKRATNANKAVIEYSELRTAAQQSAVMNEPEAAKIVSEARGVKPEGTSPSQVREAAVAQDRKALASTVKDPATPPVEPVKPTGAGEPVKPSSSTAKGPGGALEPVKPTVAGEPVKAPASGAKGPGGAIEPVKPTVAGEPVKAPGAAAEGGAAGSGVKGKVVKGVGVAMAGYMVYHGVTRAAEEAGKEAAEKGDSALTSIVKTAGYTIWHGLGFGAAVDTGKKAGEESAQQWGKDVREGKVDPTSKASQAWAQIRAVGWGLAEFTGLTAIKDATVEGAGYVKDRYGQYQAEKAEAAAKAAAPAKSADTKTGDTKTADTKAGDTKAGDAKTADTKTADTKAGDAKTGDAKTADAKAGDGKGADGKGADGKGADSKTADGKDGKPEIDLGNAITAAGLSAIRKDKPKPPVQPPVPELTKATPPPVKVPPKPVVAPPVAPPPPPPPPTTTEVEGGWVKDSKGMTKVVYIQNAKGERIGGYYVKYDANGRETGRESFTVAPEPQQPSNQIAALAGSYRGSLAGQASGSVSFTINGSSISGSVNGSYSGDSFTSSFSGTVNADGSFNAPVRGTLQGKLGNSVKPYPFSGSFTGRVGPGGGSGSWSGRNQYGGASGNWRASR